MRVSSWIRWGGMIAAAFALMFAAACTPKPEAPAASPSQSWPLPASELRYEDRTYQPSMRDFVASPRWAHYQSCGGRNELANVATPGELWLPCPQGVKIVTVIKGDKTAEYSTLNMTTWVHEDPHAGSGQVVLSLGPVQDMLLFGVFLREDSGSWQIVDPTASSIVLSRQHDYSVVILASDPRRWSAQPIDYPDGFDLAALKAAGEWPETDK